MDETISLVHALCPDAISSAGPLLDSFVRSLYPRNLTFDDKSNQLATYTCEVGYILDLQTRTNAYVIYAKWVAFVVGLCGCVLALITLTRKEYATCVTMIYHKSINSLEIFSALITLQGAVHGVYGQRLLQYQIWAVLTADVAQKLMNCFFCWVNLIVLWVTVERVLGCAFVTAFQAVNRSTVAYAVVASAGLISACVFLPYGFGVDYAFDNATRSYAIVQSDWARLPNGGYATYTLALSIFTIVHSSALFVGSAMALSGLIAMTKRKKALATDSGNFESKSHQELLKQCSFNIQLCVLQMCETIPCVLNQLLFSYVTIRYSFVGGVVTALGTVPQTMTYAEAVKNSRNVVVYLNLVCANGIGVLVSHFCRFYWYVVFSPKVRRSFVGLVARRAKVGDQSRTSLANVVSMATIKVKSTENATRNFDDAGN